MAEYIEREAAIEATHALHFKDLIQEALRDLPAADVQPVVRGRWENDGGDMWNCSICGYGVMPWNVGVNFCPKCGADMRERGTI